MLVDCPECAKRVSDRAAACPECGFPIAEELATAKAAEAAAKEAASRERVGETDCAHCEARGFRMTEGKDEDGKTVEVFGWCVVCEHTGRVVLCRSAGGYFAVAGRVADAFVGGATDLSEPHVVPLGTDAPAQHRYTQAGKRFKTDG